ncbi:MAG: xanthine dehydrogenase family protein subunit M [Candidatus Latescibacteria bacterium]|nr:xanthine dehydrogenase family protein subunit M [Candidatus Latescibacterota bacterium]
MIPDTFDYVAPTSVDEAVRLIAQYGDEAKILAGGHSLIPMMKLRLARPKCLIDIGRISSMNGISEDGGTITIGAMTTHYAIESSALLKEKCPLLPETASTIGDAQVRNRGTIGGSLSHADPAADWPAAILALGAKLVAVGPKGTRTIHAGDFFLGMLTTALHPEEILTKVVIPSQPPKTGDAYLKVHQSASGFAIVGVAASITRNGNGRCTGAGIGVTGIAPAPFRASVVEDAIVGKMLDGAMITAAAEKVVNGIDDPLEDIHASGDYRLHLAKVFTKRAIERAVESIT